jgi:seryl-tRNA synthetase
MIDLKELRENPDRFRAGAAAKNADVDIDRLLLLDKEKRHLQGRQEQARSEQKKLGKESGPQIGKLKGELKAASPEEHETIQAKILDLEKKPLALKQEIQMLDSEIAAIEPELRQLKMFRVVKEARTTLKYEHGTPRAALIQHSPLNPNVALRTRLISSWCTT